VTGAQIIPSQPKLFVPKLLIRLLFVGIAAAWIAACSAPQVRQGQITVSVVADGVTLPIELPAGSTAQDAVDQLGVTPGTLDRVDPPLYTLLSESSIVTITRVREEFEVEQVIIPFERQVLRNESLPEGESRLSQAGSNGIKELTYRRVFENDLLQTENVVRSVIVQEPVSEIVMIGSQAFFASLPIPGRLVYLSAGNAWVMEGNTGNRRPIVATGDLDGRVFSLSPDGKWLLYTRNNQAGNAINSLWMARVDGDTEQRIDLKVSNIIHFAQFNTDANRLAYSTVEPRATAPGWQANNELNVKAISPSGLVTNPTTVLEANAGGVYGWWGMDFFWSPDSQSLAYAQPDEIGIIDLEGKTKQLLLEVLPLQTRQDWAWVPSVAWSPDSTMIYTVSHTATESSLSTEESPRFDLIAVPVFGGAPITLVSEVGMFAYPVASPVISTTLGIEGEVPFQVAYLQASQPLQSETSRYQLVVIDRDGSNKKVLFPKDGAQGLEPQQVTWSPEAVDVQGHHAIAFTYQGNIWLVDLSTESAVQVTGDGLTVSLDWR
jgi:hypothetical protein